MVSGIMVGILEEQHAGHIVLSDSTRLPLADGLILERFGSGAHVTIDYSRDSGGEMVVQSIKRTSGVTPLPSA
jgi:hypothetical protein